MLDFAKVNIQLGDIDWEIEEENSKKREKLEQALRLFEKAIKNAELIGKIEKNKDLIRINFSHLLEGADKVKDLPTLPEKFVIAATDGSQIMPSHHEISFCYLINVGRILYIYGTGDRPLQDSQPFLYYKEKDLYISFKHRKVSVSEELIAIERMQAEIQELVKLSALAMEKYPYPLILMVDGTLVNLSIDNVFYPDNFKNSVIDRYIKNLEQIRNYNAPICGYISNSRKNDFVNFLRLSTCPYKEIDCDKHCKDEENCVDLGGIVDRKIWEVLLELGQRSPMFMSSSNILEKYPEYRICFFYLKLENEVARIEIPLWVAQNEELLDRVHILCYDQTQKGYGYPVALSEAHNKAVIKGEDRAQFFSLISRKMLKQNRRISLSSKELRKRSSII